jgi:hypothetical protein
VARIGSQAGSTTRWTSVTGRNRSEAYVSRLRAEREARLLRERRVARGGWSAPLASRSSGFAPRAAAAPAASRVARLPFDLPPRELDAVNRVDAALIAQRHGIGRPPA